MYRALGLAGSLLLMAVLSACGGGGGSGSIGAFPSATALGTSEPKTAEASAGATGGDAKDTLSRLETQITTKTGEGVEIAPALRPLAVSAFGRNTYHVYAANGNKKLLRLDFTSHRYEMLDSAGQSTSGSFSEDASEPGTYVFASSRIASSTNTPRFRVAQGAIVGAFPFEKPWSDPAAYAVVPFVAANNFVSSAADLDGDYNRFGVSLNSDGSTDSQILALRISGAGTVLDLCSDNAVYQIDQCPNASRRNYTIATSPDAVWTARGTGAAAGDLLQFRMARIQGQNVWLSGGSTDAHPYTHVFHVGLRDSITWAASRSFGASTEQSWGSNVLDAARSVQTALVHDGSPAVLDLPVSVNALTMPRGIRSVNANGARKYYAMKNDALSVLVGTRNPNTQGYIQVNLITEVADIYQVFATNGTRLSLRLDLEAQTYLMRDGANQEHSGTFSADPNEPGTYVFFSPRIASPTNTARFRLAENVILGGFPFAVTQSVTVEYAVQPFVGSRALEPWPMSLSGTYNRFGIDVSATALTSNISQFQISDAGTQLVRCTHTVIYRVDACPGTALQHWTVSSTDSAGIWRMTETANPTNYALFAITRLGGQKVFLLAGKLVADPMAAVFRIGLTESGTWPTGRGYGITTKGSGGSVQVEAGYSTRVALLADGTTQNTYNPLTPLSAQSPLGIRAILGTSANYFAMQGAKIYAIVGANAAETAGYLQLNLMD